MCVIFLAYLQSPERPLVLLANRDEFYDRPSKAADYWEDFPDIYGGRDEVGGGTWLGITRGGRFAAVTNYRDPKAPAGTISRGNLVADFLKSNERAESYLGTVHPQSASYSGFSLLAGEIGSARTELFYYSNREGIIRELPAGIYGLSNRFLDTPWPKIRIGKERLGKLLNNGQSTNESFFELLADRSLAPDANLPDTGIGLERERSLSPIFIETPVYGTRCSTVLTVSGSFEFDLEERVFV